MSEPKAPRRNVAIARRHFEAAVALRASAELLRRRLDKLAVFVSHPAREPFGK